IFEVLDPIPALASINADRGRSLLRAIQPSIERVLVHTDGKDTRHSFRQWINTAARICPANALIHVGKENLRKVPSFGDMDQALPIALHALSGTLGMDLLSAGWIAFASEAGEHTADALAACEASAGTPLGRSAWSVTVASIVGDRKKPQTGTRLLVMESAKRVSRDLLEIPEEEK